MLKEPLWFWGNDGSVKANKFEVEHESKINDASIVIINACGFIESAKEGPSAILDFVDAKETWKIWLVVVGNIKTSLKDEIPDVDAYFGSKDFQIF